MIYIIAHKYSLDDLGIFWALFTAVHDCIDASIQEVKDSY